MIINCKSITSVLKVSQQKEPNKMESGPLLVLLWWNFSSYMNKSFKDLFNLLKNSFYDSDNSYLSGESSGLMEMIASIFELSVKV